MGTPDFAVPCLRVLIASNHQVIAVVTQPDREKGRKRIVTPPPVKVEAIAHGIPVLQPAKLRAPEAVNEIAQLKPDLIVTAAYGQILPKRILELPAYGCINVHASLLPKYRGGAPIHHAVMNGETLTGVTIMYMAEGLDTGDMISQIAVPIDIADTTGTLHDKLSHAGARLLEKTLPDVFANSVMRVPQKDSEATYAPNIRREDEWIDWHKPDRHIYNQVRGLNPWPVAYTTLQGAIMKVWKCRIDQTPNQRNDALPGTVLAVTREGIVVACGEGCVVLTEIQPAGKKIMPAAEFCRGAHIHAGMRLGVERL
ncbi:MAG TPA: methionyl-tRNA formyltransferase [Bacilli bacterium]